MKMFIYNGFFFSSYFVENRTAVWHYIN